MIRRIIIYEVAHCDFPSLEDCNEAYQEAERNSCVVRLEYCGIDGRSRSIDISTTKYASGAGVLASIRQDNCLYC